MLLIILIAAIIIICIIVWDYYRRSQLIIRPSYNRPILSVPPVIPPILTPSDVFSYNDLRSQLMIYSNDTNVMKIFKSHTLNTNNNETIVSTPDTYFYTPPILSSITRMFYNTGEKVTLIKGLKFIDNKINITLSMLGKYNRESLQFITNTYLPEKANIVGILRTNTSNDFVNISLIPNREDNMTIIKINTEIQIDIDSEFYLYITYLYDPAEDNDDGYCR